MLNILRPGSGLLFRITHVANVPWLLANRLHAATGAGSDPDFVPIGAPDLIGKRMHHSVPVPPGGVLAHYVPFYLTPKSPMLMSITTGYNGVRQRPNTEIVVLVASWRDMPANGVTMLYTDRHAFTATARWITDPADFAAAIDWDVLRRHDFIRDDERPDKVLRYQAEALAHLHVPASALRGIGCVSESVCTSNRPQVRDAGLSARVVPRPDWYFR